MQHGAFVFVGHDIKFQNGFWRCTIGNNKRHVNLSLGKLLLKEAEA